MNAAMSSCWFSPMADAQKVLVTFHNTKHFVNSMLETTVCCSCRLSLSLLSYISEKSWCKNRLMFCCSNLICSSREIHPFVTHSWLYLPQPLLEKLGFSNHGRYPDPRVPSWKGNQAHMPIVILFCAALQGTGGTGKFASMRPLLNVSWILLHATLVPILSHYFVFF